MSSPEESSFVQVMDSNEPLVTSSSLVLPCLFVQVIDSSEPLVQAVSPLVQEPHVPVIPPSEPEAGCSRAIASTAELVMPASPTSSESGAEEPRASGSSGRRVNFYVEEIRLQWNMFKLVTRLNSSEQCIKFAEDRSIIPKEKLCNYHKKPMTLSNNDSFGQLGMFRCRKSNCRNKVESRAKGTWFQNVRLQINIVFQIMYMFSQRYTYLQVKTETAREDRESVLSTSTIADWYSYCREAVIVYKLEHQEAQGKIGGAGKTVQIDESKFGKRKYNRGRHIEGHWVLGMT